MALRRIIIDDDSVLRKKCREVEKFDEKLAILLDDMAETMHDAEGVGLAAPQVGILRRVVVVDIGDGVIELVNPEIISKKGRQEGQEGCLSYPNQYGTVCRPMEVEVKAYDRHGKPFTIKGKELLARAFCHEIDHLNGIVFKDLVSEMEIIEE